MKAQNAVQDLKDQRVEEESVALMRKRILGQDDPVGAAMAATQSQAETRLKAERVQSRLQRMQGLLTLTRNRRKLDHLVGCTGAQVLEVSGVGRICAEFLDDREEVGERADRGERRRLRDSVVTTSDSKQKGGFDELKGDRLVAELGSQPAVGGRGPAGGRVRQPAVEIEEAIDVDVVAHEGRFLLAAASASLSRRL